MQFSENPGAFPEKIPASPVTARARAFVTLGRAAAELEELGRPVLAVQVRTAVEDIVRERAHG